MKKILFIDESEKARILEMHKMAIDNNLLTEQSKENFNSKNDKNILMEIESFQDINPKKLKLGDGGSKSPKLKPDVIILQNKLISLGCLITDTGKATGYFGPKTDSALKKYKLSGSCKKTNKVVSNKPELESGILDKNSSLLFDGDYLYWISSGNKIKKWNAISGLTIKNALDSEHILSYLKSFIQSKDEWMKQKDAGPIPTGKYMVGPLETRSGEPPEINAWQAAWYFFTGQVEQNQDFYVNSLKSKIGWGNYRLMIMPLPGTETYKRVGFYIHGGSLAGSHGCIDLTDEMKDFAKTYAAWTAATNKKRMQLEVSYKDSLLDLVTKSLVSIDKNENVDLAYLENKKDNEGYA